MITDEVTELVRRASNLQRGGQLREAELQCDRALAQKPDHAGALHVLGIVYQLTGRAQAGLALLRRAVAADPADATARTSLATALGEAGRLHEAVATLRRAVELWPDLALVHNNLGIMFERMGRFVEAAPNYARAADLDRRNPLYCVNWGNALHRAGDFEGAEEAYRRALALRDDHLPAWKGLGLALQRQGRPADALQALREVVRLDPLDPAAHSNLLYTLQFDPTLSARQLVEEHVRWATRHEAPLIRCGCPSHDNDRSPDRRLRVGYVSADFREHTSMRFMEPVLANHDHAAFEIYCYSDVGRPDAMTRRVRRHADVWRETAALSHEQLAALVQQDRIDVLVEFTGHMGRNRLPAFARKPAPVQVTYPGYPATTGMTSIDYLLTDAIRDPPGSQRHYTEQLVFLEPAAQCYCPGVAEQDMLPAGPPPCLTNGCVTFASLNQPVKANAEVVTAWARILSATSDSRLMVLATERDREGHLRSTLADALHLQGIDRKRILPVQVSPRHAYLERYREIDIALDPWPFNGHTTTLDALWMGVPVVALEGATHVARESSSILSLLGLREYVAHDVAEYVEIATGRAADMTALADLRSSLRDRLRLSALGDAAAVTRQVERAYRHGWRQWCEAR